MVSFVHRACGRSRYFCRRFIGGQIRVERQALVSMGARTLDVAGSAWDASCIAK